MGQAKDDLVRNHHSHVEPNETPNPQGAARVFIAGEFVNDWGHLDCMLVMARAYRAIGCGAFLAVSDLNVAMLFFAADDSALLQAPILRVFQHPSRHHVAVLNFADLWCGVVYADPTALAMATNGWIGPLAQTGPKLLAYVNAPTVVLSTRVLNIPTLFVGGTFDIPPAMSPLPTFRKSTGFPEQKLALAREAEAVENINSVLSRFQRPALEHLRELFLAEEVKLTTLPELDPLGLRLTEQCFGLTFTLPTDYLISDDA